MAEDPSPEQLEAARQQGQQEANRASHRAPSHPLLHLAWAQGFEQEDQIRAAVDHAREAGYSWAQVAVVLGLHRSTAQAKYGSSYSTQRRYRERKKGES